MSDKSIDLFLQHPKEIMREVLLSSFFNDSLKKTLKNKNIKKVELKDKNFYEKVLLRIFILNRFVQ